MCENSNSGIIRSFSKVNSCSWLLLCVIEAPQVQMDLLDFSTAKHEAQQQPKSQ